MDTHLEGLTPCFSVQRNEHGAVTAISGLFQTVHCPRFPSGLPEFFLYGRIRGLRSATPLELRMVYFDEERAEPVVMWRRSMRSEATASLKESVQLLVHREAGDYVDGPGEYRFELWHENRQLGGCSLIVDQGTPPAIA